MKTKLSILLTALLLLFCFNVNAQVVVVGDGDKIVTGNRSDIVNAILDGSDETTFDVNTDQEVNIADVVELNNMVTVNLQFKNTGSQTIRLAPRFRFVLSSGKTTAAWFAPIWSTLVLSPGETKTIENVKMPKTRHFLGKTFAEDGDGYDSNVVLYDESFNSTTFVPEMISSSTKFNEGSTYKIYVSSSSNTPIDDNPQGGNSDNPTNQDNPPVSTNISINLNIINQSGKAVTLDGQVNFVLNPDNTRSGRLDFNTGGFTLGAGSSQLVSVSGELGGRSPLHPSLLTYVRNVLLYVGDNSEVALADNLDPNIVFQDGQTYNVIITTVNSGTSTIPDNPPASTDISINLNIINQSGKAVTLDGDVNFVLANPDVYGNYHGWGGEYNRSGHLYFNTGGFTLGAGESRLVSVSGELGGRSPLRPSLLTYVRNVLLYVGGVAEVALANNLDPDIVFQDGQTYNVIITTVNSGTTPTPTPTGSDLSFSLNLINASGRTVTLDGDVVFVLANPDVYGNYHGWRGEYNRSDHIYFTQQPGVHLNKQIYYANPEQPNKSLCQRLTIPAGESRLVYAEDLYVDRYDLIGGVGRSPLDPSWFWFAERKSNVLLYIDGNSEAVICDPMDTSIIFQNGGTYNVVFR